MSYKVIRTHEICAGHRVVGHESKCRHLHGHNYVFHFEVVPLRDKRKVTVPGPGSAPDVVMQVTSPERTKLDELGRVIDFSVVKSTLCEWLELNWDHRFLHWEEDELIRGIKILVDHDTTHHSPQTIAQKDALHLFDSFVELPFNPTAENLAAYMVNVIGPKLLDEHGVELVSCRIEETSKCHVEYTK